MSVIQIKVIEFKCLNAFNKHKTIQPNYLIKHLYNKLIKSYFCKETAVIVKYCHDVKE